MTGEGFGRGKFKTRASPFAAACLIARTEPRTHRNSHDALERRIMSTCAKRSRRNRELNSLWKFDRRRRPKSPRYNYAEFYLTLFRFALLRHVRIQRYSDSVFRIFYRTVACTCHLLRTPVYVEIMSTANAYGGAQSAEGNSDIGRAACDGKTTHFGGRVVVNANYLHIIWEPREFDTRPRS